MENNENLVTEQVTENVEQTTEETPKTYTEAEFNERVNAKVDEVLPGKIARKEAKIRKEYDRKYGELLETLKAGTGKEDVGEITDTFKGFYESKGIKMPTKPDYSDKDIETLAKADAEEIIRSGFEEVIEEADRLKELGVANMSARDKALFVTLTDHIKNTERRNELAKIGVTEDVYNSKEFQEFASMYKESTPISVIYDNFNKTQPKKQFETMGSMKGNAADPNAVKDYYSFEEASKFTKEDFDKNPALYHAVQKSMLKW
jgi:hypothetical protein